MMCVHMHRIYNRSRYDYGCGCGCPQSIKRRSQCGCGCPYCGKRQCVCGKKMRVSQQIENYASFCCDKSGGCVKANTCPNGTLRNM